MAKKQTVYLEALGKRSTGTHANQYAYRVVKLVNVLEPRPGEIIGESEVITLMNTQGLDLMIGQRIEK